GCIRVREDETLLHQRFLVVERHTVQIDERLGVHKNPDIIELKDAVALTRLAVKTDVVAQPRAAAALHSEAQSTLLGRDVFLLDRHADARQGLVGDLNALGGRGFWFFSYWHVTCLLQSCMARVELVPPSQLATND